MIDVHHIEQISQDCSLTEFVGTTVLDTIGLVIPGIDPSLLEKMNLKRPYKSLGLISSRTGAAGQINAADEAKSSPRTRRLFPSNFLVIQKAGADTVVLS